eukprot:CAMPEP_0196589144 /NCGR_PEP_ID=MMETSP1081-20130531/62819_1 /TAXON_ID=36882 /ORGANISM="Pyramimonas amylifera, Strain CCMP720" /LENGTH=415 /DNA_ID=CAMNT_0041911867 /DNA_START=444 /DNA_END=1691 /DNA_ORIENTATION=-
MEQGNIAEWKMKEGDKVSAGDILCSIETDKATLEMESMEDGFLAKILMPSGSQNVAVGTPIAVVCESGDNLGAFASYTGTTGGAKVPPTSAPAPPPTSSAPAASSPPAAAAPAPARPARPEGARIFSSPLARKTARDLGMSLDGVSGTGPNGRIVRADVLEAQARGPAVSSTASTDGDFPTWAFPDFTDLPIKQVQKITAARLLESKQTVPHYYLSVDVRMDALMKARSSLNAGLEKSGAKLSVTDLIIKASALTLIAVPEVNASWLGDVVRRYHAADITVAVQTEHGLMVPIVKDADTKGLVAISADVKSLAAKARENKLTPSDYVGGTFAISNLGMFGVKQFCAIINPPQACILAVGSSEKRVIPGKTEGTYEEGTFMCATISCDHRVVDGAVAAQWLAQFKKYMEDPMSMLL